MYLLCVVLCYLFSGRNWIGRKGACVRVDFHCIQVKCFMLRICFKSSACPTRGRVSGSRSTTFCNPIFWPDSFAKKMWLLWGAYWRIFVSVVRYPPPHSPLYNILCGGPDRTPSPQKTNPPTHLFMAGIWIEKRSIVWGIHFVGMLPFKYHCHRPHNNLTVSLLLYANVNHSDVKLQDLQFENLGVSKWHFNFSEKFLQWNFESCEIFQEYNCIPFCEILLKSGLCGPTPLASRTHKSRGPGASPARISEKIGRASVQLDSRSKQATRVSSAQSSPQHIRLETARLALHEWELMKFAWQPNKFKLNGLNLIDKLVCLDVYNKESSWSDSTRFLQQQLEFIRFCSTFKKLLSGAQLDLSKSHFELNWNI